MGAGDGGAGDTSMAQDAYNMHLCFLFDFGSTFVALFNGLMISDIRMLILLVYCL